MLQRFSSGNDFDLAGFNLSYTAANFPDLRSLNRRRNALPEHLHESISNVSSLRRGKLLYLRQNVGNGFSHGLIIASVHFAASTLASFC